MNKISIDCIGIALIFHLYMFTVWTNLVTQVAIIKLGNVSLHCIDYSPVYSLGFWILLMIKL